MPKLTVLFGLGMACWHSFLSLAEDKGDWEFGSLSHVWSIVVACVVGFVFLGCLACALYFFAQRRRKALEEALFLMEEGERTKRMIGKSDNDGARRPQKHPGSVSDIMTVMTDEELAILVDSGVIGLPPSRAGK